MNVPRVSAFYGIVIRMFFDDHPRAHFHAEYGEYSAKIAIDSLEVVAGSLTPRALRLVRQWGSDHRLELEENWNRARRGETLKEIEPLP